ncbi:MAG: hypothetical protein ACE5F8_05695 [Woeseiaceae bacterium]
MTFCKTLIALMCLGLVVGVTSTEAADGASDSVKVSVPLSARNAAGVEFERSALVAAMATDGCTASCSGGTMYCTVKASETESVTYTCGCCGAGAGCMQATRGNLKLWHRPVDLALGQDVLEVEAGLISSN